jgi:tRNA A-37 threonylcarbamoyl transferase component Bud32/tetratricopeptide (TPR) repeat protein
MTDILDRLIAALQDRYTIERELGSGGMATVYLAEDLKLHRKVALKVLRPELASALGPDRFLQEIDIAAKLAHPHILPLHDCGEADGFLYYVMTYVEGQSLRDKLAKEGELPIAEAVRILRDVVDALSEAHEKGVVHRDIKPDNVLLTKHHALVTDFGVAKAVSEATGAHKLTTEGVALGTPAYMAPEQAAADPHIDHRADIYAVGVIAYELLTGRTPFVGNTQQALLAAHVTETPDPVTKYRESVPPSLAELVMKCLEKKAADRWQTAEELLPQLEALATPSGGTTPVGKLPVNAVARTKKIAIGAAAVAVVLAALVVVMLLPRARGATLDPDRVLVAVLENETGETSLDLYGAMAGHWITQGLQKSGVVQVVPWLEAQQASQYVASEAAAGNVRNRTTALAEETGAGTVISGAYYRRGETVQYRVDVTDAMRGRSLGALDPVIAPLDSPDDAIETLMERVIGFLAISLDERISDQAGSVADPPSFEAYREFDRGLELYLSYRRSDDEDPIPNLYRALNLGHWAQLDSMVVILERHRDGLSAYDRHWLDYLNARADGDHPRALRAMRGAAALAPGSKAVYNRGIEALNTNRPQEAVDAFLSLNPSGGPMRGWVPYYLNLCWALHMAGQHGRELEEARRSFQLNPDAGSYWVLFPLVQALAESDRVAELHDVFAEVAAVRDDPNQGFVLVHGVQVLDAHGHTENAHRFLNTALEWLESLPSEEAVAAPNRMWYGHALTLAGRYEDGQRVFDSTVLEFPEFSRFSYLTTGSLPGYAPRGARAVIAALRGDTAQARTDAEWFEQLDPSSFQGEHTLQLARIAAILGERERAVRLYRQSIDEGLTYFPWYVYWEPGSIRGYPPFQELMRPKG